MLNWKDHCISPYVKHLLQPSYFLFMLLVLLLAKLLIQSNSNDNCCEIDISFSGDYYAEVES